MELFGEFHIQKDLKSHALPTMVNKLFNVVKGILLETLNSLLLWETGLQEKHKSVEWVKNPSK